jgi:hypothetical protein
MNQESQWRLEKGKQVAAWYAQNPKLAALVVAGSVGRGWADEWSDIELDLFWREPPTDADRKRVIEAVNGEIEYYFPLEGFEWSDAYFVDGLKFEISSFLATTIDESIRDVIEQYDIETDKQLRFAALQNSIVLHGDNLIQQWRARLAQYPDALAEKIIRDNVDFGGWNSVELAFVRGDLLMAYDLMTQVQKQVITVLLALNRTYMGHPRGKWLQHVADGMQHKPARLAERMLDALREGSVQGAREMDGVIEETFALVEQHFPQIDLTDIKRDVHFRRARLTRP